MILIELNELNKRLAERFCLNCKKDCTFCEIKEVGRITESMPIYKLTETPKSGIREIDDFTYHTRDGVPKRSVGADYLDSCLKSFPNKSDRDMIESSQRELYKP